MVAIIRTYEGTDIVIPGKAIEEMGLKPGDTVVIRPNTIPTPAALSAAEKERRFKVLESLYGLWTEDDEAAFERNRGELWSHWQPPNLS